MRTDTTVNRVALEIIKKHTYRPDADYSDSWILKAMEEYGNLKWNQACEECAEIVEPGSFNGDDAGAYILNNKPEFKP